jgi:hypothetical protein
VVRDPVAERLGVRPIDGHDKIPGLVVHRLDAGQPGSPSGSDVGGADGAAGPPPAELMSKSTSGAKPRAAQTNSSGQ